MFVLLILAVISLVLGVALLTFDPKKLEQLLNKTVVKNEGISLTFSKILGIMLIILAGLLFYIKSTL